MGTDINSNYQIINDFGSKVYEKAKAEIQKTIDVIDKGLENKEDTASTPPQDTDKVDKDIKKSDTEPVGISFDKLGQGIGKLIQDFTSGSDTSVKEPPKKEAPKTEVKTPPKDEPPKTAKTAPTSTTNNVVKSPEKEPPKTETGDQARPEDKKPKLESGMKDGNSTVVGDEIDKKPQTSGKLKSGTSDVKGTVIGDAI